MNDPNDAKKQPKKIDKIKSSLFSRSASLAKITFSAGASLAKHGVTTAFKSTEDKEENWKNVLKGQASLISSELGELKGSLMKAGQMLSMYGEHFLPPEATVLLRSLQSESPPLHWEAVKPIVEQHLGPEKMALLEIETDALAAASMGQVHRAKIKATGELIALKIQYPNVDKAIDSDLRAIRTLLGTLKLLPKDFDMGPVFAELRTMLQQETDYVLEAQLTEEYGAKLAGDSRYIVPRVYREFSGAKILATSFERGLRVDDPLVQNLAQKRRNQLSLNFIDLYFKEIFDWGVVQTDPHSGNYRIRVNADGNDQLILFDFGATRKYAEEFLNPYRRMVKSALLNKREEFLAASHDLKFLQEGDSADVVRLFEEFCMLTVEPFMAFDDSRNTLGKIDAEGLYDWKKTDLPQRVSKKAFEIIKKFAWRAPPSEILFLDRKTGGVFIFLSIMGAKIRARDLILKYIDKV